MVPISNLYSTISKGNIDKTKILDMYQKITCDEKMQVYLDYGKGFSEHDTIWIHPYETVNGESRYRILINKDVQSVRIDPSEEAC